MNNRLTPFDQHLTAICPPFDRHLTAGQVATFGDLQRFEGPALAELPFPAGLPPPEECVPNSFGPPKVFCGCGQCCLRCLCASRACGPSRRR